MLLHLDGSSHAWFQDDRRYDLLVILDDATSEIYYAQLVEEESTATVMTALREVIERKGAFCALYSDRASVALQGDFSICRTHGPRCTVLSWFTVRSCCNEKIRSRFFPRTGRKACPGSAAATAKRSLNSAM